MQICQARPQNNPLVETIITAKLPYGSNVDFNINASFIITYVLMILHYLLFFMKKNVT